MLRFNHGKRNVAVNNRAEKHTSYLHMHAVNTLTINRRCSSLLQLFKEVINFY